MVNIAVALVQKLKNEATKAWAVDNNDADLIEGFEGLRLNAYLDSAGVPTIGWGNTRYKNGTRVKMGDKISRQDADDLLLYVMKNFERDVRAVVHVPLNDNQGAALLSLHYNTGCMTAKVCTLRTKLNAGDYMGAANQFLAWNKSRVNGILMANIVLTARRVKERQLFLKP